MLKALSLMALLPLASLPVLAEEQACLGLADVMTLAARNSPAVATSRAARREAEAGLASARSLFLPQVSGFARAGTGEVGLVDSSVQSQVGLRVTQRLFDFGDARFARDAARESLEAAGYEVDAAETGAAHEAGHDLLSFLNAGEAIAATRQRQDYFIRQLELVERLLEQNEATLSDRAQVAAELAEADAFIEELRFQKDSAETRLRIAIARDGALCTSEQTAADLALMTGGLADIETAIHEALGNNPELAALSARADSLAARARREKRNGLPVVSAVGTSSYASGRTSDAYDLQEHIGVDISVPIYSGRALLAERDRAGAREAEARSRAADARRQLEQDVRITWQRLLSLSAQKVSRQTVEDRSREQFEAAEREYAGGTRTLTELVEARLRYEDATLRRIALSFELLRQQLTLLHLTSAEADGLLIAPGN